MPARISERPHSRLNILGCTAAESAPGRDAMDTAPEIRTLPIPIVDDPGNGIDWLLLAGQRPMVDRHPAAPGFKLQSAPPPQAHHLPRCQEIPSRWRGNVAERSIHCRAGFTHARCQATARPVAALGPRHLHASLHRGSIGKPPSMCICVSGNGLARGGEPGQRTGVKPSE